MKIDTFATNQWPPVYGLSTLYEEDRLTTQPIVYDRVRPDQLERYRQACERAGGTVEVTERPDGLYTVLCHLDPAGSPADD